MGEEFAAAIELARNFEPAQRERLANTLGDVLYSRSRVLALEAEWVALVRSVAAGNQGALHALYTRAHRPVFTLIMRILAARGPAEEVTLDVFHDVWRRADDYDAADTTVLGWMMNLAHSRATERQRLDVRKKRARREVKDPTVVSSAASPAELLRPSASLQERLAQRIKTETNDDFGLPPKRHWSEPEWEEVSPGIFCKLLATDAEKQRVSMLVRLLPGVEYPPHTHAEFEELHLLDGELWIDERKLRAGAYNRAEAATRDKRVWSETGCICVLVTSTADVLD
jgi:DNA-directed RNA polymerase specialized sigma24 family protein